MKNLLSSGLVSFALLAGVAVPAPAGTFGLIPCPWCCKCCCCKVCIKQYNAFSPCVSGCITADGCLPPINVCAPGGPPACDGVPCVSGDGCAMAMPDASPAMTAAQYQYLMYQQQMAAQFANYPSAVPAQAMPAAPVQSTGFVAPYYYGTGR
jgi:hypothetical protein